MSKQDEEINELNTICKATLGVSKISGIGVIALRDIKKGEVIYADRMPKVYSIPKGSFGKLFPYVRKIIFERWPNVIHGSRFISPDARLLSFMNHGGNESNYNPTTDTATKDIREGEEITEDYCIVKDAEKVYPWLVCENI